LAGSIPERPTRRTEPIRLASSLLALCLLAPAAAAWSGKGQKSYKEGLRQEQARQWEKAAEEFSLAVAAEPSNSEYQLHLRRALFNASQAFSQQGAALLERGDYLGAYNAFRRAYAYDPANELARSMMERAFKLQTGKDQREEAERPAPVARPQSAARLRPTAYETTRGADDSLAPARNEQLQSIQYSGDLEKFVRYLARQLRINVVFDRDFPRREDSQTDIVIAVTPHVMRASSVNPEDEEMHPSGTLQTPTTGTLEAMMTELVREEQLAAARTLPTHASVEVPSAPAEPTCIPAPKELLSEAAPNAPVENPAPAPRPERPKPVEGVFKPAAGNSLFSNVPAATVRNASLSSEAPVAAPLSVITEKPQTDLAAATATSAASLRLMSEPSPLRVGERRQLKLLLKTDAPLGLLALSFRLDPRVLALRSVGAGTLSTPDGARVTHTLTPEGLLLVSVAPPTTPLSGAGVLLTFEVEALSAGAEALRFDADDVHLVATDGRKVLVKVMTDQISVRE
jgi:hypothetical protein